MKFSRAQQGKINLAQARADDMSASSVATFNKGIQESKDDGAYKIFAQRLKILNDQSLREYNRRTGQADVLAKAVGIGSRALNLIPGVGPVAAAVAGTALTEGTRALAGGYEGVDDKQLAALGMPNTLFKTKTVRHDLFEQRDNILDGYDDVEEARKINLAIGAVTNTIGQSLKNKAFDDTIPEGSPTSYGDMVDAGEMDFLEGLKSIYIGGVNSESFYDKSISAFKAKKGITQKGDEQLTPFLRSLYNLYPELSIREGYDRNKDVSNSGLGLIPGG
tara:strand:+ start:61 stop:891 length:831 start_codon:yes stop_codon:yes gene_type:complete